MSLVLLGRECSKWGCRPKPHQSLRSLVATHWFKSLGFRYAPVVFFRATQKRYVLKRASCAALHPCCGCASRFFLNSLPASPTAQTVVLCAVFKCITRSVSVFNPQIVRVSAIHPCIAQAAPELLTSSARVSPASRPWPHATGIPERSSC